MKTLITMHFGTVKRLASRKPTDHLLSRLGLLAAGAFLVVSGCQVDPTPEASTAEQFVAPEAEAAIRWSQEYLRAARPALSLDADHTFRTRSVLGDKLGQAHVRYDQLYRGVEIWEGDAIAHVKSRDEISITSDFKHPSRLEVTPTLSEADARTVAANDRMPKGPYVTTPQVKLVVYPITKEQARGDRMRGQGGELNAVDVERITTDHLLAYHVHFMLENGDEETDYIDYLIDAHSGTVLKKWSTLMTAAATGTGNSQYSGNKSINVNTITGGYELNDVVRGMPYKTYNLNHATSGTGTIYTDPDNTWGDNANYVEGSTTTAANGQTAAVDAHFGAGMTYDYFKNVHGRNGIDGAGTSTYSRVHYGNSYDNAFWDDSCFCMTYGDGSSFTTLTSIDVVGHEMTHGVTSRTANLTYSGESGGLNEAMSDIHGTMVEFYSRGGSGSTINNTGGTWTIAEQLRTTPLRYMYKPSLDGQSANAWSSTLKNLDVHYSSGPMNRAFYFLSQGASNVSSSNYYSSYLPNGMNGVGNDHAARIAYRALSVYMTSSTNYSGARTAFLSAASDLYGTTDTWAVQNAFAAINVGAAANYDQSKNMDGTCYPLGTTVMEHPLIKLVFQSDGNLVLYKTPIGGSSSPAWATGTNGRGNSVCLQGDGNLVVYGTSGPHWASNTNGSSATELKLQGDCNLVLYTSTGVAKWATSTNPCN